MTIGTVVITLKHPVLHVAGQVGTIDEITEIDSPTECYYDALRKDMTKRHPKQHVMDHVIPCAVLGASTYCYGALALEPRKRNSQ